MPLFGAIPLGAWTALFILTHYLNIIQPLRAVKVGLIVVGAGHEGPLAEGRVRGNNNRM